MQSVIVVGNLTADAETQAAGEKTVVKYTVADNSGDYTKEGGEKVQNPEFFRCEQWFKTEPTKLLEFLKKGKTVAVDGKMKTTSYGEDDDKKYSTILVVNNLELH